MAAASAIAKKAPFEVGTWVTVKVASRRQRDRLLTQTPALITAISIEGDGCATLLYPIALSLQFGFGGKRWERREAVPFCELKKHRTGNSAALEAALLEALRSGRKEGRAVKRPRSPSPSPSPMSAVGNEASSSEDPEAELVEEYAAAHGDSGAGESDVEAEAPVVEGLPAVPPAWSRVDSDVPRLLLQERVVMPPASPPTPRPPPPSPQSPQSRAASSQPHDELEWTPPKRSSGATEQQEVMSQQSCKDISLEAFTSAVSQIFGGTKGTTQLPKQELLGRVIKSHGTCSESTFEAHLQKLDSANKLLVMDDMCFLVG